MRRRNGLLDELMDIGSRLPWGVAVVLAIVSFSALHYWATRTAPVPGSLATLGALADRQLVTVLASLLQYVVPICLLLGAVVSWTRRRRGVDLLEKAAADPARSVHSMQWQDFERLVGANFERSGFDVEQTGGGGADGGVDLILRKGRETTLVQCKQWRAQKVGVKTVRELYGVMAARGAAHGMVVTVGDFTPDALEFVSGRNIELLNGRILADMLRSCEGSEGHAASADGRSCPKCGARMIRRTARKGPTAGQAFWGCETYPKCRATAPI